MRLTDIKKYYRVDRQGDYYNLYTLKHEDYQGYLCSIEKKNTRFKILDYGVWCGNVHELIKYINLKLKSYEFPSDFYNPSYRKGVFEEQAIHWYMKHTLGLERCEKSLFKNFGDTKIIYQLDGCTLGDYDRKQVTFRRMYTSYKWNQVTCDKEINAMKKAINSLVLKDTVEILHSSFNTMNNIEDFDMDSLQQFEVKGLNLVENDIKSELKDKLKLMLEQLGD